MLAWVESCCDNQVALRIVIQTLEKIGFFILHGFSFFFAFFSDAIIEMLMFIARVRLFQVNCGVSLKRNCVFSLFLFPVHNYVQFISSFWQINRYFNFLGILIIVPFEVIRWSVRLYLFDSEVSRDDITNMMENNITFDLSISIEGEWLMVFNVYRFIGGLVGRRLIFDFFATALATHQYIFSRSLIIMKDYDR